MNSTRVLQIAKSLEREIPSLTATSIDDAAVLHAEALEAGGDWEFLGVFESLKNGVRIAAQRGGEQFQANCIPFEFDGMSSGYFIYFSRGLP